jgi:hypothetical protein
MRFNSFTRGWQCFLKQSPVKNSEAIDASL